jgi:adenylate cyclase
MGANVEIKARLRDPEGARSRAEALAGPPVEVLYQVDTFFDTPRGRLKLRRLGPDLGELIFYDRPNASGPKLSEYRLSRTSDPAGLLAVLSDALEVRGEVKKTRTLHLRGRTRIHLDEVEGLGEFLELEVVLAPGEPAEAGHREAEDLRGLLGIPQEDLIQGAYLDLLARSRR